MSDQEQYPRPELLVDPDWLAAHRTDPDVRIVDCGQVQAYERAHIPGAVSLLAHAGEEMVADGAWLKEPSDPLHVIGPDTAAALFSALGIAEHTTVVAYDDFNGTFATRLWWVLTYYGHPDVRVLNGGWQRWLEEGHPVTFRPTPPEPATFEPRPNGAMRIRLEELKDRYVDPDVQVVNVLWPEWYDGTANPLNNPRVGHIPESVNVPIERFLTDGEMPTLRPPAELQSVLADAGLTPDKETVVHCQAGIRTTMGAFALTLLGWDRVRAYEASIAEWSRDESAPLTSSG